MPDGSHYATSEFPPTEDVRPERAPVLPVFLAFAAGIAGNSWLTLDRNLVLPAATGLLLAVFAAGRLKIRVPCLLAALFCLGAAAHHHAVQGHTRHGIVGFVSSEPCLARLRGRVATPPVIETVETIGWARDRLFEPRTRCLLECTGLQTEAGTWLPARGRVQFTLLGALPHARVGDEVEALGWLREAASPRNPGGFDLRARDRNQRIDARLFTEHAMTVRVESKHEVSVASLAADARREIGSRFDALLSPENAAIARAMLLGERGTLSDELRDAYHVTGAMHVLAISGMHVAILAGFLVCLGRAFVVSPAIRTVGIVTLIWAYAALTGFGPPVTRSAVFLTLWAIAICLGRTTTLLNTVALAGLVLLAWNPLLLFDLGTQLSFLAVLGMSWAGRLVPSLTHPHRADPFGEDQMPWSTMGRWLGNALRSIALLELAGIGIWLFTGPLIAGEFGLIAPISLPLNILLVPLSTVVLLFGYLVLVICPVSMPAAVPFAFLFDNSLWLMNGIVEMASTIPGGHDVATPPSVWWLAVWYPLLLASLLWLRHSPRRLRAVIPLLLWGIVALAGSAAPDAMAGLRLTVLDVGHGGAILIETPDERTILYDCGSMHDDRRAAEIVWDCLRHRGHRDLDALIISHADLDHCNNVPALLRTGRVHSIFVNRTFLNFAQPVVAEACEAAGDRDIPIRLVARGDILRLGSDLHAQVLHPPDRPPGADDNANSLVLRLEYRGRGILLTGDLEGAGQFELFARYRARTYDVVIAPHHGGALANTPEFARWCRPANVLVSCGDRVNIKRVQETYSSARRSYFTSRDGAITVTISPSGGMGFETEVDRQVAF